MPTLQPPSDPEFSFPIEVTQLPALGRDYAIDAVPEERAQVARRLNLRALDVLHADAHVRPVSGGLVRVTGRLTAKLTQTCVVTLAPVPAEVEEEFSVVFAHTLAPHRGVEQVLDPDEEVPDLVVGGRIDLGEIAVEQLALALEPYPRAPGAVFDPADHPEWGGKGGKPKADNPFSALAKLRTKH